MSEANIRRLIAAPGFQRLRTPVGFEGNIGNTFDFQPKLGPRPEGMDDLEAKVLGYGKSNKSKRIGASEAVVADAADDFTVRLSKAKQQSDKLRSKAASEDAFAKPFDPIVEHVRNVAVQSKGDGEPTVLADVASALMSVDASTRDLILRRAGNPSIFESLRTGSLPEPDGEAGDKLGLFEDAARKRVNEQDKKARIEDSTKALPEIKRPSSHLAKPDSLSKRNPGKIIDSSDQYKNFLPRDVGVESVTSNSPQSEQNRAIRRLAGDQIAQVWRAQDNLLIQQGWTDEEIAGLRSLPWAEQRKRRDILFPESQGSGVTIGSIERKPKKVDEEGFSQVDTRLTTGTDPNYWRAKDARSGVLTTDKEIARRNRSTFDRVLEMLDTTLGANPVRDAATGELKSPVVDLDRYFPWWRARFAVADQSGNLSYPARLPSAEFVTGMIEGMYGIQDPQWFDRMLPLIQRSIDAAPDSPVEDARPFFGNRTARQYADMVFLPSPSFAKTMQDGIGSADYPYDIYGPRSIARPQVTAPERHPFLGVQNAGAADADNNIQELRRLMSSPDQQQSAPVDTPEADASVEELRRLMAQPGLEDQTSIYRMPQNSPVRFLLA